MSVTTPQPVPARWQNDGPRPATTKPVVCRICGLDYAAHSGKTCAICLAAVEHHLPHHGEGPVSDFADCLARAQRMATVRRNAGVALNDLDRRALDETS